VTATARHLAEQRQRERAGDRKHRRFDLHLDPHHVDVAAVAQQHLKSKRLTGSGDAGERAENGVTSCRTRRRFTKSRV